VTSVWRADEPVPQDVVVSTEEREENNALEADSDRCTASGPVDNEMQCDLESASDMVDPVVTAEALPECAADVAADQQEVGCALTCHC
jgi:hypothetical protein